MLNTPEEKYLSLPAMSSGFSIIELMLATMLSISLISVMLSFTASSQKKGVFIDEQASLEDELRTLRRVIASDLARADYVNHSSVDIASPLTSSVQVGAYGKEPQNSCIVFFYDKNQNGKISDSEREFFGYRLRDHAIERRVNQRSCSDKGWHDVTDINSTIVKHFAIDFIFASSWGSAYSITIALDSARYAVDTSQITFMVEVPNAK